MMRMIIHCLLMPLDVTNSSAFLMTLMNPGGEIRDPDTMNNLGLWLT